MGGKKEENLQPTWKPTKFAWAMIFCTALVMLFLVVYFINRYRPEWLQGSHKQSNIQVVRETPGTHYPEPSKEENEKLELLSNLANVPFVVEKSFIVEKSDENESGDRKYIKLFLKSKTADCRVILTIDAWDEIDMGRIQYMQWKDERIKSFLKRLKGCCIYFARISIKHINPEHDDCMCKAMFEGASPSLERENGKLIGYASGQADDFTWVYLKPIEIENPKK